MKLVPSLQELATATTGRNPNKSLEGIETQDMDRNLQVLAGRNPNKSLEGIETGTFWAHGQALSR